MFFFISLFFELNVFLTKVTYYGDHLFLKMLYVGLYLYTLIIGHKSVNMLSILNKLTLKKELKHFVTNNVF